MRIWIFASAAAVVALAGLASAPSAAEPWGAPQQRSSSARAPIFPAAHAWVNRLNQEAAPAPPAPGPALRPAIAGNNIGQGSGLAGENGYAAGAAIAPTAWNHEHVYSGYVFGPGSCDHTPPCVDHLWDGYCQRPCRCGHGHFHRHFFAGCGHHGGCATCGPANHGCGGGCFGGHCGGHFGCHACNLHHLKHKLASTFDMGCGSGCSTCATAACGCNYDGHKMFAGLHRGWFGSLCSACDGGMSCGCGDSGIGHSGIGSPASDGTLPAGPAPELIPKPALSAPPEVPAEDGKSARRITRFVSGSFN